MMQFTKIKVDGSSSTGWCPSDQLEQQLLLENEFIIVGHFPDNEYYFNGSVPVLRDQAPSENYNWDSTNKVWSPDIEKAKKQLKIQIDNLYEQKLNSNISYAGHIFQADATTRENIKDKLADLEASNYLVVDPAPLLWRDFENNNYFWTDVGAFTTWLNGFIIIIAARKTSLFIASVGHKDAITALTTLEAVEAYNIQTGW
jgi:hypothetical protein